MSLKIVQSPKGYAPFFGRMPGTNNQKPTANLGILPKKSSAGSKIYRLRSVINWMILAFLVSFFEGIEIFFFHLKFFQKKIKNHLSLVLMGCLKLEYYEDNRVRTCVPMRSCEANGSRGFWKSEVDIEYLPFGEVFIEEKNSKWNTPYLFTSKELDRETGMYYFGARYYTPKENVWLSVDEMAETSPNVSSYAYCLNNPVIYIDPDGRKERANDYQGKMGKGDWREDDRILNTEVWQKANKYNLQQQKGYKEYNTIEQRAEFYKWFQNSTESRGYDTKWAGGAFVIASQMSNVHSLASSFIDNDVESDIKAFAEKGNKDIFDDVFKKLRVLYNGSVLKGEAAKEWDRVTLTVEQRDVVGPDYFKNQALNSKITQTLSQMAKGQGVFGIGVAKELRFDSGKDIMKWQDRFNHGMTVAIPFWNKYYSKR